MVMGQTIATTEVLIIGAGPGGYVAAIRAAQLGFSVMLVDKGAELGGMCLHHGCIPSKALIYAMNFYHEMHDAEKIGIHASPTLDFKQTQEWKKGVVKRLNDGIAWLCQKHNIKVVKGTAKFENNTQAIIEGEGLDFNTIEFRYCVIATGSKPRELPWAPFGGNVLSSKEVLELDHIPNTFCVIGGGYIGIELGVMLAKGGARVTIIEATDRVLGIVEPELVDVAVQRLKELGATIKTGTKVEHVESHDGGVRITAGGETMEFEKAMVAIGHVPVTDNTQLELAGVQLDEKGFIKVDDQCRTTQKNIYAVGDNTGGMMLAHKASAQGRVAAEAIAEKPTAFTPQAIPAIIFSDPEIASVGLREQEAKEKYGEIKVGKFPFAALGKAIAITHTEGFIKIISDKDGLILGIHGVGPHVTDYISEAALAIEMGCTAEDLALTIHPHPTLAESLSEASEALLGQAIHLYQPRK